MSRITAEDAGDDDDEEENDSSLDDGESNRLKERQKRATERRARTAKAAVDGFEHLKRRLPRMCVRAESQS